MSFNISIYLVLIFCYDLVKLMIALTLVVEISFCMRWFNNFGVKMELTTCYVVLPLIIQQ